MHTMHSVLLVGPYDWQPELLPEEEFRERLARFWRDVPDPSLQGAVVYADTRDNAELVYLTGFTPKVRQAMALIPRTGEPVVLSPGTKAGLSSARRLTWVKNVDLLADPLKAVSAWREQLGADARVVGIGLQNLRGAAQRGLEGQPWLVDATALLRGHMAVKRMREVEAIRRSAKVLAAAASALEAAHRAGATATQSLIKAEQAAWRAGAQDVQMLYSVDGGRTLRPYEGHDARRADPLQTHLAVRVAGYWAAGFVCAASSSTPMLTAARDALAAMIRSAKPGVTAATLGAAAQAALGAAKSHPLVRTAPAVALGVALDEQVLAGDAALNADGVYSLQCGATDDASHALASAMVVVRADGTEVLWQS